MDNVILKRSDLMDLLRSASRQARQDVRKQICSASDAMDILDMSQKTFYGHLNDPACLIRKSSKPGKYVLSSVYDEAKRLNFEL